MPVLMKLQPDVHNKEAEFVVMITGVTEVRIQQCYSFNNMCAYACVRAWACVCVRVWVGG
jgi:hypothetical protein